MSDLELDLKRKLRQRWKEAGYWSCPYEPGLGSATGYPDLQLLHPTFRTIAPIELKVADKLKDGRIFPREVRPAQVTWNYEFAVAGGRSAILIGHKTKTGWDSYVFSARWLKPWREGFLTEDALFIFEYEDCVDGLLQTCSWCAGGIDHALVRDHNVSQNRVRGARLLG